MNTSVIFAFLWMLGAMSSLFIVSVMGRELAQWYDTFEIMLYRSLIGVLILVVAFTATGYWRKLTIRDIPTHIIRNGFHFTAQNLWLLALSGLPLGLVTAFEFSTPAWVVLLAPFFLGEKIGKRELIVIALGMIGVVIIADPGGAELSPILLAALACPVFFALTTITTKFLTNSQTTAAVMFMMTTLQSLFALVMAGYDFEITGIAVASLPFLFIIGFAGVSSHWCLTQALSLAPASTVAPIDLLRLPLALATGALIYGETLTTSILIGGVFLIIANIFNILRRKSGPPLPVKQQ